MNETISIFLCGDVMIGRGIDQIQSHPSQPQIYESFVKDARDYVGLAEELNGKIPYPVAPDYIWGDALSFWQSLNPAAKIINLETAITASEEHWLDKEIHYRMNPLNIDVLASAKIDICTVANNHILDWGYPGLNETLNTLKNAGIKYSGAGENLQHAMSPAIVELPFNKRILVFSVGSPTSGVTEDWEARSTLSGVYYLPGLGEKHAKLLEENIRKHKRNGDLVILSIHWGSNWGYEIQESFQSFAHNLIDSGEVDVIFGHSSHHPRPIEIYNGKPIFYGCGDFINDYEGIESYKEFRGDLSLMYFLDFDQETLQLKKITLIPLQIKNFKLNNASELDCEWMHGLINKISSVEFVLDKGKFLKMVYSSLNKTR